MLKCQVLTEKLRQINQKCFVENELKKLNHFIQAIDIDIVTDILNELLVLVITITMAIHLFLNI